MSLRDVLARFAAFGKRDAIDAALDDEMAEHLRMLEEENIAAGMSASDARHAARRAFGNPTAARERSRESWGFDSIDAWLADVRFGMRVLRKRWPSTLVAVLALGLGIGATTAAVSALDAVAHRRYTYDEPERIALLWAKSVRDPSYSEGNLSPAEAKLWARSARGIKISSFGFEQTANVAAPGMSAERVISAALSVDLLSVLGVHPIFGRDFVAEDGRDAAGNVALVSYAFWQRALHGDRRVIGDTIVVDRQPWIVIGVLPRDFELPTAGEVPLLVPIRDAQWRPPSVRNMTVVGRLGPDVTTASIAAQLSPISAAFTTAIAGERGKWAVNVEPLAYFGSWIARVFKPFVVLAWLVLLIACTNVAILLLARIPARERELAVRAALGAGPRRLFRQVGVESGIVVALGTTVGVLVAAFGAKLLAPIGSASNFQVRPTLTSRPVIVALLAAAGTCLIFGLAPVFTALRGLRERPVTLIGSGRASGHPDKGRLRMALIAVEAAMSVILLTVGALMVESMLRMRKVDIGFDGRGLVTARITLDTLRYRDSTARRVFFDELIGRLATHHEVHGVTAGTMIPLAPSGYASSLVVRSDQIARGDSLEVNTVIVEPGYFTALGIPVIRGSEFSRDGHEHSVIINENLARKLWPGQDPIGRRLRVLDPMVATSYSAAVGERLVSGVVKSPPLALASERAKTFSLLYLPYDESASRSMYVALHAPTVDAGASAIRREVAAIDAALPIFGIASIDDLTNEWLGSLRLSEAIGEVLAGLGLTLTLIGIYSVVAVLVAQRTHEIGIRLAIGARASHVVYIVMRRTLMAVAIGSAVGVIIFAVTARVASQRVLGELLYETSATNVRALFGAVVLLALVVVAAAYSAARRAATLDPLIAIRAE
jgi:putative ABC transport system permease protein